MRLQTSTMGLARVAAHAGGVAERLHLGQDPREAVLLDQLLHHAVVDAREVSDVVLSVAQLLGVERAARPVGERLGLGQADAAVGLHERGVAHLLAETEKGGGQLRVEDGRAEDPHAVGQDLEVLSARVEDLGDGGVLEQRGER